MRKVNSSLLQRRLHCFVGFIAPKKKEDPKFKGHFKRIEDRLRKHALEEGYTIAAVQYSGSFAKSTGLRRHVTGGSEVEGQDIDIAVIFEDKKKDGKPIVHSLIPDLKRYLTKQWPDHLIGHTKSSATLSIPKLKLSFDIVPFIKTHEPNIQKLIRINREVRTSSVQKHTEFIRNLNRQGGPIYINNGLRLVKWWRYHQQTNSKIFRNSGGGDKVPSFLLDLLCAKAFMESPRCYSYPEMLYQWFKYLARVTRNREPVLFGPERKAPVAIASNWQVIDPVDPTNNVVENWALYQIKELAEWFKEGRDLMMQAMHFDSDGRPDDSLNCLKKIFGPSIKTNCKQPT